MRFTRSQRSTTTSTTVATSCIGLLIYIGALIPSVFAAAPVQGKPDKVTLVVKTAKGLTQAQAQAFVRGHGASPKGSISKLDLQIIEVPAQAAAAIIKAMKGDAQIVRVETDRTRKWQGAPSDTQYTDQWALPKISWDQVYGTANPRFDTKVAILDTGVD